MTIRTAIIPAAGLGTRFLPFTKSVPKELLPIFDTPAIQFVIDEAVSAGIEHVVLVSSRSKPGLEQYLRPDPEVIRKVRDSGRSDLAERLARLGSTVRTTVVYQDAPLGLGHAVACARSAAGDESFAVLLPDEIMGSSSLLEELIDTHRTTGRCTVGLKRVPASQVSSYGVVAPRAEPDAAGHVEIESVVEKPQQHEAPSDLIIIGRYVLDAGIFDELDRLRPSALGEIQLTDALLLRARSGLLAGVLSGVERHDTGTPISWVQAVIDLTLQHPTAGPELAAWLQSPQTASRIAARA